MERARSNSDSQSRPAEELKAKAEMRRYHPLLITNAEAKADPEKIYSDHLPTLYKIPLAKTILTIISWNIWDYHLPTGFAPIGVTADAQPARALRITKSLVAFQQNTGAEVIILQENFLDEKQLQSLATDLKAEDVEDWAFIKSEAGLAILYNTIFLKPAAAGEYKAQVQSQKFKYIFPPETPTNTEFTLNNVHIAHEDFPTVTEALTTTLLTASDYAIVVGDFNSRIAPLDNEPQNIVTGVVPYPFREGEGQGCDWTDGAFYKNGASDSHHQAIRRILNFLTGDIYLDAEELSELSDHEFQQAEETSFRPVMQIDTEKYQEILRYQKSLQLIMGDEKLAVQVKIATNSRNESRLAVLVLNAQLYQKLITKFADTVSYPFQIASLRNQLIFLPLGLETMLLLYKEINSFKEWQYTAPKASVFSRAAVFKLPPTLNPKLMELAHSLQQYLPENGQQVDQCRGIKGEIAGYLNHPHSATAVFANILLANYFLQFNEYNTEELGKMGHDKQPHPPYILRPTHFASAINILLQVCQRFHDPVFTAEFTDLEAATIRAELIQLGQNIFKIYSLHTDDLAAQSRLYDVSQATQPSLKFAAHHYEYAQSVTAKISKVETILEILQPTKPEAAADEAKDRRLPAAPAVVELPAMPSLSSSSFSSSSSSSILSSSILSGPIAQPRRTTLLSSTLSTAPGRDHKRRESDEDPAEQGPMTDAKSGPGKKPRDAKVEVSSGRKPKKSQHDIDAEQDRQLVPQALEGATNLQQACASTAQPRLLKAIDPAYLSQPSKLGCVIS